MSKQKDNFSDIILNGNLQKEFQFHSCILKSRCKSIFKKITKKDNDQMV